MFLPPFRRPPTAPTAPVPRDMGGGDSLNLFSPNSFYLERAPPLSRSTGAADLFAIASKEGRVFPISPGVVSSPGRAC